MRALSSDVFAGRINYTGGENNDDLDYQYN